MNSSRGSDLSSPRTGEKQSSEALFRRKGPEIVRKSSASGTVEERKTVRVKGQKVEVRRVAAPVAETANKARRSKSGSKGKQKTSSGRNGIATTRTRSRRPVDDEIIVPTESSRKQMLVSANRSQTQIVILEGPVLVDTVARNQNISDPKAKTRYK